MVKLTFRARKKTAKIFPIYKNPNRILSKKAKKGFQKRLVKDTKIFLGKKKQKAPIWL